MAYTNLCKSKYKPHRDNDRSKDTNPQRGNNKPTKKQTHEKSKTPPIKRGKEIR